MLFSEAISGVEFLSRAGADAEVTRVTQDSRVAAPGAVFVAMRGGTADGNSFISQAMANSASAIITDSTDAFRSLTVTNTNLPVALCAHGRKALAGIAANLHRHPERRLKITGITGTNGKTTTTFLLEAMLQAAGRRTALLGTIENHLCGQTLPALHTTPEPDELYALLNDAADAGVSDVVMEVSSHALDQGRVWGVAYDVALFSNLTRDHLDYHGTMDAYWAAKRGLFTGQATGAGAPRDAVINIDDATGRLLAGDLAHQNATEVVTFGLDAGDFRAANVKLAATGSQFTLQTPRGEIDIRSALAGRVNVMNLIAAAAAAHACGLTLPQIAQGAANLASVPGRFQQVQCGQDFAVVVDYAHTDDALRNLTKMARELVQASGGRVITLFGCGGDRDKSKRPLMASASAESSDLVILTSDNPRSEGPADILRDAEAGFPRGCAYQVVEDRAMAISQAIARARAGDIVLIAGKGHEKTQTMHDGAHPFDDVAVARQALEKVLA
jgi:UDP-N-acetylmuramoyl-L-alanyl-D-glutamate--2,6-diaminopimelate ligase